MPLLDIATAQPCFQYLPSASRAQALIHGKILTLVSSRNVRLRLTWKSFQIPEKGLSVGHFETRRIHSYIKAVATFENWSSIQNRNVQKKCYVPEPGSDSGPVIDQHQSSNEDSMEVDEKERLRRMRISKANKGNTPWNKGRKHSPETRQRIRERTKLAMQDPKVKMKLVNLGHAQSEETRLKIGVGVRMGWQKRREKLRLQETCYFLWQNLIAEASREGFLCEEELQWDSYNILDEQLQTEWLESIEQRKKMPRPKGNKRAPKSLEQRRRISEAISAKWNDPGYRNRVYSGLAKYHGIPDGAERKPRRRKPKGETQSRRKSPENEKSSDLYASDGGGTKSLSLRTKLKRSSAPQYKDPLASSKLEMIKSIRAQRSAIETKKTEAIEHARLLIAEAEKAAEALEVAAMTSPIARASLIETRKLIAEAIQSIESANAGLNTTNETSRDLPYTPTGLENHIDGEFDTGSELLNGADKSKINGAHVLASNSLEDIDFTKFALESLLNDEEEFLPTSSSAYGLPWLDSPSSTHKSDKNKQSGQQEHSTSSRNGTIAKPQHQKEKTSSHSNKITKKWVRGRLVEVAEGE